MIFYDNMKIILYKVIRAAIYAIIDNSICLDNLGLFQYKLSKMIISLKKQVQLFYGLVIPEILMNIM